MDPEKSPAKIPPALAEFDRQNAEAADWRRIEKWLVPGVKTREEYREKTLYGAAAAVLHLWNKGSLNPSPDTIREAHQAIFGEVRTDAGVMRKPGQQVIFGRGTEGAEPQRIAVELSRLHAEMGELLAASRSVADDCAAIAHYHARYIAIHPFLDGNGRSGRVIMQAQARLVGQQLDLEKILANKPQYLEALSTAIEKNDVAPLTRIVGQAIGHEVTHVGELRAHAKIRCRRMLGFDDIKPLEEERAWARTGEMLALPSIRSELLAHGKLPENTEPIVVEALRLKEQYRTASDRDRRAILESVIGKVRAMGGTDVTGMQLRIAMSDFIRGEGADLDLVRYRANVHAKAAQISLRTGRRLSDHTRGLGLSR